MDFTGGKIYDAVSAAPLSAAQVGALTPATPCSLGCVAGTVSDNTVFQVAAKYTIGPWKFYGGYEHVDFANPNNPLTPGAFLAGGYNVGAPNNTNFTTDRILQTFWVGAKYSVRPDLDLALAYYHENQNSFIIGNGTNPTGTCNTVASAGCSGSPDAASFMVDYRFAKHFDAYAGIMWSQVQNGLANGSPHQRQRQSAISGDPGPPRSPTAKSSGHPPPLAESTYCCFRPVNTIAKHCSALLASRPAKVGFGSKADVGLARPKLPLRVIHVVCAAR